jgi:hypothetical protein
MFKRLLIIFFGMFLLGGCAGTSGKATRSLTESEVRYLDRLLDRVNKNGEKLKETLETLANLSSRYIAREYSLALSISKAKLLESLRSPWAGSTTPEQSKTQRAVTLYHLYDLAEAEREVITAKIKERRAAVTAVADNYSRLSALLNEAIQNEKVVLAYLDQPSSARIGGVVGAFLEEAQAFHRQLTQSEHPELRGLAGEVAKAEEIVSKAKDRIEASLTRARSP